VAHDVTASYAARYYAERRRAQANTADPQGACREWRDPREVVAELMAPCATVTAEDGDGQPAAWCGVPLCEHHLTDPSDKWPQGRRTYCTRQDGPRRRPCNLYTPATE
jgi:hypothetical protein